MSQPPQNPYGTPPPVPPYGQPPMPPYGQGGYPPQPYGVPQTTSGAAIASLVLGFVGFCVPVIGGLIAIVLGIVGIGSTGKPNVKGRGLAIAGLVLGVLTLLGWSGAGLAGFGFYRATAPDRATARSFLTHVGAGDTAAAATDCVPGTAPEEIQALVDRVKPLGALSDTTFVSASVNSTNGATTTIVAGNAVFGTTPKSVQITLAPGPTGKRLVQRWVVP